MSAPLGRTVLNLNGPWSFQLDPEDVGMSRNWHEPASLFCDSIRVPGVWQAQGFGEPRSQLRHDYQGKAWYQHRARLPQHWKGRRAWLSVGGVLRRSDVWVNGSHVGHSNLITTPFVFDITAAIDFEAENVITIRVDNLPRSGRYTPVDFFPGADKWDFSEPIGAFNSFGNWGGIYDDVEIFTTGDAWIDWVHIRPDIDRNSVSVSIQTDGPLASELTSLVTILDADGRQVARASTPPGPSSTIDLPIPDPRLWSPEDPYLYSLSVTLGDADAVTQSFGMRKLSTRDNVLLLNNRPCYLRGFSISRGDCLGGMIPVDRETYLERFRRVRRMGFNYIRWHSTTPPRAAFDAADATGLLMQVELPVVFAGFFMPHLTQLHNELERILICHRNHPSFLALAFGNEFNVERDFPDPDLRLRFMDEVQRMYDHAKSLAGDILVMSNCGYVLYPADLASSYAGFVTDRPTVKHESGNYRHSLPDVDLVERFTGVLLPDKLRRKRDWLRDMKLIDRYPDLRRNSERLQHAARKQHFQFVRQIPDVCGYQYWQMADNPADPFMDSMDDGILNCFWEPTKAVTEEEIREINGPIALLLTSDVNDRTFWVHRGKSLSVMVSHYGREDLRNARLTWSLRHERTPLAEKVVPVGDVSLGSVRPIADIQIPPLSLVLPAHLELRLRLDDDSGQTSAASWSLWAFTDDLLTQTPARVVSRLRGCLAPRYPFVEEVTRVPADVDLLVTSALDPAAFYFLRSGGTVLWLAQRNQFDHEIHTDFFGPCLTARGTLIEDHPALACFPHDRCCDLQFFNLMEGGFAVSIPDAENLWMMSARPEAYGKDTPPRPRNTMTPVIWGLQVAGQWTDLERTLQRLAWLVEARVGPGKLLLCTLNVLQYFDDAHPEAVSFLDSLLRYALSDRFDPAGEIPAEELSGLLTGYLT